MRYRGHGVRNNFVPGFRSENLGYMIKKLIVFGVLFIVGISAFCQSTVRGSVKSLNGEVLIGASVSVKNTSVGCITDAKGNFVIECKRSNTLVLEVHYIGYQTREVKVTGGNTNAIEIRLEPLDEKLNEVTVKAKSKEQKKREEPIKIEVINVARLESQSVSLPQVINQTSGVRVRQYGGIGSNTSININGLQDEDIRFFKDDIPMDYLGNAFSLSLLPVDQLSNIEIYKGVLPVKLGADALGGAVNFISKDYHENHLDLSYGLGSYNAHQATANAYLLIPKTKLFAALSSYYVYSDNNYKVKVKVADEDTGKRKEYEVERFHGAVESAFVELKTGLKDSRFADLFEVGVAYFDMDKELQNDIRMKYVYGEVMYYEDAKVLHTRYQKSINKWHVDVFGAYSDLHTLKDDTPENAYDWFGVATPKDDDDTSGEGDDEVQSYRNEYYDNYIARANVNYQVLPNHTLSFNHNYIYKKRVGSDPYANTYDLDMDVLTIPAIYERNITGLGLTSVLLHEKIKNVLMFKRYGIYTRSVASSDDYSGEVPETTDASYGFGNSVKYSFNAHQFIRISYEYATRIPNAEEYLGELERSIVGNPDLEPERSQNINVGYSSNLNKKQNLWFDLNLFYRYVNNEICLQTFSLQRMRNENLDDTKVLGGEMTVKGEPLHSLHFNMAVTYQDIRRTNIQDSRYQLMDDARRPNIPYFFGSFGLRYHPEKMLGQGKWDFYGNYTYVEQYLLSSIAKSVEPSLFGKADSNSNIIPTQNLVDVGITYKFKHIPLHLNAEINNALDAQTYDAWRVQKPGRNFRFKIKYSIH